MQIQTDVVVVGAGQAGLAMSYHLKGSGIPHIVVEKQEAPGGSWPSYYDSLTLFSPARHSSLPGYPFPGGGKRYPRRDDVVQYLRDYARKFGLPIQVRSEVERIEFGTDRHLVCLRNGPPISAGAIVVASGGFNAPYVPDVAGTAKFCGEILHSASYRNTEPFHGKRVVVVGAANSAVQIAYELSAVADVTLATRERIRFAPQRILGLDFHDWLKWSRLERSSWLSDQSTPVLDDGRYRAAIRTGALRRRQMFKEISKDSVIWPDGECQRVDSIIYATGYRFNAPFLEGTPALDDNGHIHQHHGASSSVAGLFYLGIPLQRNFASATLRGVGNDASAILPVIQQHIQQMA
ncbi:NAD(P)/FAD-dependent oxidoreductase [Stenotrophomonas sp. SY1]|uniref:flavin-containing monooxygenase n=1 Tax=Stenotrophomonas sp. SY1 TaxID=477235 RepID=UPI001E41D4F6|nr:NAD(P)/FAD-dependent oxidoreductase [Stenotrophomonas sp. SY1]MCD9085203.1 NAD(P)/FAD-dependent oxidoreductase [Stenotrophomonas sp. SY1]